MAQPALQYISTLSHKRHDFLKNKVIENKMCVLIFCKSFVWNIFHSKKKWARYDRKTVFVLHVKCPLFSSDVNEVCNSLTDFRKTLKCRISWKSIRWDPSCYMRTDRRADMTKVIATFPSFANAPINDFNYVNFTMHTEFRRSRMKKENKNKK